MNRMQGARILLGLLGTSMVTVPGFQARQPPVRVGDLSLATSDFPALTLFDAAQRRDIVRLRRHAWNLFAGITSQDTNEFPPVSAPIFLSWKTKADLEGSNAKPRFLGLETPVEFQLFLSSKQPKIGSLENTIGKGSVLAKVYYNKPAFDFIRSQGLNLPSKRGLLNCALGKANPEDRHIASFPHDAVAVKTMWWVAAAHKNAHLTPLPVWDPESNSPNVDGNDPQSLTNPAGNWSRYVAVNTDPTMHLDQTEVEVFAGGARHIASIVPVSRFFSIRLRAEDLPLPPSLGAVAESAPQIGDYLILVGMHVTTKEIPNWVWATFWWHDYPNDGLFASQRPSLIRNEWRNYLMNTTYTMTDRICFNPYLEAALPGGIVSNCMTCHRMASSPRITPKVMPLGEISPGDAAFEHRIKMDFLWSLTSADDANGCSKNEPNGR